MPKTKISEYSTTNADNTDIESINIAEGCAPSGINNAIRELMVHLKEFQTGASGDGFTFAGGTLMTGTNTLSGTNVLSGSTTAAFAAGTVSAPSIAAHGDTNTGIFFPAADTIAITEGGVEVARVNSSGNVGIGTDSPGSKLDVKGTLRLSGSTSGYVGIAPAAAAGSTTYTLPSADGSSGQVLSTNGSGTLSWATASGGGGSSITAGDSKVEVTDTGSNGTIVFNTDNAERMRIDSIGNVGIGTSSIGVSNRVVVSLATNAPTTGNPANSSIFNLSGGTTTVGNGPSLQISNFSGAKETAWRISAVTTSGNNGDLVINGYAGGSDYPERVRITSGGVFLVGKTTADSTVAGCQIEANGRVMATVNASYPGYFNRLTDDGVLVYFAQANVDEGNISVSGTTVSYNGGHLSRWAQTTGPKDETLLKGTVLSNLDEMNVYVRPTTYWTEEDELPEGVNVGDVKEESTVVDNEQLNKVKVSDVEGDVNVAGVFVNWTHDEAHNVDEINMAMTGDMIIRIAQGVVVQKGDLLMSAGDGTAKPQGDDIVRSKTVAKVTSNHVTCTYADGSYCVPCVLMAC